MANLESRLATLERRSSGNGVVRFFQQLEDSPTYFRELKGAVDSLRLYSQSELDRLGDGITSVKIVYV